MPDEAKARFESRVQKGDGCWEWQGNKDHYGYGAFSLDGKHVKAHRVAYELYQAPIPTGLALDHLCENKACVNPAHLEPKLNADNVRRHFAKQTHCKQGHELTPENTYNYRRRNCRACALNRRKARS